MWVKFAQNVLLQSKAKNKSAWHSVFHLKVREDYDHCAQSAKGQKVFFSTRGLLLHTITLRNPQSPGFKILRVYSLRVNVRKESYE